MSLLVELDKSAYSKVSVSARIWQKDEMKVFRDIPQSVKPLGLTALETGREALHAVVCISF